MNEARFDDSARWWFLTPEGFAAFKDDPVAQGYEILSRHPIFPHIHVGKERGKPVIFWNHANKHRPKMTWQKLSKYARHAFLFQYRHDLHRMGLLEIGWLGKDKMTFNCTEGVPSILSAAHYWLRVSGSFQYSDYLRTWCSSDSLKFIGPTPNGDQDMVTVDWHKFIEWQGKLVDSKEIVAAIRTFLEHNPEYRKHRETRLEELKRRNKHRERRLAEMKKKRPPRHLKKPSPEVIAFACAAWDCQQSGTLFREKISASHLNAIGRGHAGDSRNHLRQLRKLQRLARFKTPLLSTRPTRQAASTEDPINVMSINYPGFAIGT